MNILERATNDNVRPRFKIDVRVAIEWAIRVLFYVPRKIGDIYGSSKVAAEATKQAAIEAARRFKDLQKLRRD